MRGTPRLKDGKPTYADNFLGRKTSKASTYKVLPAHKATIRYQFTYGGGAICINGKTVAEGRIEQPPGFIFLTVTFSGARG